MAKLTTAMIKEALNNVVYNTNWKRITKRKFEYNNVVIKDHNQKLVTLNGKLNWRGYIAEDCEPTFVIDDGENILFMGDQQPLLPPSCFKFGLYFFPEMNTFCTFFRLDVEIAEDLEVYDDNIYDSCIAGIQEHPILDIDSFQENEFEISKKMNDINEDCSFEDTPENYNLIKSELDKIGFKHCQELEDSLIKDLQD